MKDSYKIALAVIGAILLISAASALAKVMTTPAIGAVNKTIEVNMTQNQTTKVLFETTMGNVTIELYNDMPITAGNFKKLVDQGFYDGVIFHRIIPNFMAQGGDPTGTGTGGPGYKIKDEFTTKNRNDRGTISMANSGPNTGGSQFFINMVNNNFLDTKHPVFGKVISGMDVVDAMAKVKVDRNDKPLTAISIQKASVIK